MATETYKWFRPDSNRRDGVAIVNNGDSAETSPFTLMTRAVLRALGLPFGGTRTLFDYGTATDTFVYARCPDLLYSAVSPYLTAAELATVVSVLPAGWTVATPPIALIPNPRKRSIIVRGDSITAGLGTTSGDTRDIWLTQAINGIAGETLSFAGTPYREAESKNYYLGNMSLGGSNWDNSVAQGLGEEAYPLREALAYAQRTATHAMNSLGSRMLFIYSLGTNDPSYDASVTGAIAWARAAARIAALRAAFPAIKIAIWTLIKRSEASSLNNRLNDYNVLARANYASAGADALIDVEANVPQLNITTGNTGNTTYYTDGTHITTVSHGLVGAVARPVILSQLA